VLRHVARLVIDYSASRRHVVDFSVSRRLVVDYSASLRLVVDYFASTARPGASARRAARHRLSTTSPPRVRVPWHVAWLIVRLVAPLVVDYSTSRRLVIDYFASTARQGASARRAARHAARRAACRRLLHLAQARRRLLRLA
jgi:hypothetical protein